MEAVQKMNSPHFYVECCYGMLFHHDLGGCRFAVDKI